MQPDPQDQSANESFAPTEQPQPPDAAQPGDPTGETPVQAKAEGGAQPAAGAPEKRRRRNRRRGKGGGKGPTAVAVPAADQVAVAADGLRIEAGVTFGEVAALGLGPDHAEVRDLVDLGLLVADPQRLRASPAGRLVLNALTERLALAI